MEVSKRKEYQRIITAKYLDLLSLKKSQHIPKLVLSDIYGKDVELSSYQDSILYIDFWASWCMPCIEEIPKLIQLQEKF